MAKPSKKTPEQKLQIVLAVLRGQLSAMDAARRNGVSEQSVHNWKRLFLESGREGLEKGARRPSSREMDDGEVGDIVWPRPQAQLAVELWQEAAGDAVEIRQVTASQAADTRWQIFDTATGDARPRFVTVEGINPTKAEFIAVVAAATVGDAPPVLPLDSQPDQAMATELRDAGWRLTDARELLPDQRLHHPTPTTAADE